MRSSLPTALFLAISLFAPSAGAKVEVLSVERAPTDLAAEAGRNVRLRATLAYFEKGRPVSQPLSFWRDLRIVRDDGSYSVPPSDLLLYAPEGASNAIRGAWQVIILVDSSRSMLARQGEGRRFDVALNTLQEQLLQILSEVDAEVAIEPFDCTVPWANKYLGPNATWMTNYAAMTQRVSDLRRRYIKMAQKKAKNDRQGMCTSLYQSIAEADRALVERRKQIPRRQPLLIVLGDGQNDIADGPGRVWDASFPSRTFASTEFLASPLELAGRRPHRPIDLIPLYNRIVEEGLHPTMEEARDALVQSYQRFAQGLSANNYVRWPISVGAPGHAFFDPEVVMALGQEPIMASEAGALESALRSLVSILREQVQVNFSTNALDKAELNTMRWRFLMNGQEVGQFTPTSMITVATDIEPACEVWEDYCQGRGLNGELVAFGSVMAVLILLWWLVPRYFFEVEEAT